MKTYDQERAVEANSGKYPSIGILTTLAIIVVGAIVLAISYFARSPVDQPLTSKAWNEFSSPIYAVALDYPDRLLDVHAVSSDGSYARLGSFVDQSQVLNIEVISDVEIYQSARPADVASREIRDAGGDYEVRELMVGDLTAATTTLENATLVTIAHPTRDLFVVLTFIDIPSAEYDRILSSFRFTDL